MAKEAQADCNCSHFFHAYLVAAIYLPELSIHRENLFSAFTVGEGTLQNYALFQHRQLKRALQQKSIFVATATVIAIATARRFTPIRRTITINQIINKRTNVIRRTSFLYNTPNTQIMQLKQFLATNRTERLLLLNFDVQLAITTNTKPSSNMKPLNTTLNTRMIQLIPSGMINTLTLAQNFNIITIL